jgi:hypothetical protein
MSLMTRDKGAPRAWASANSLARIEVAPVTERGEGIAHAHRLRLGQVRAQPVDLRLRRLQTLLQLAGLVLHLGVGGEQELDDDPDLLGRGKLRQVPAGLRQGDGVPLPGFDIAAHEVKDGAGLGVELRSRGFELRLRYGRRRRMLTQRQPDDDAEPNEAEDRKPDQPGLDRRKTRGEHAASRTRARPPAMPGRVVGPSAPHSEAKPLRSS